MSKVKDIVSLYQCCEEVRIGGTPKDMVWYCIKKPNHKGSHELHIAQKAIDAIIKDESDREKIYKVTKKLLLKKYKK